MPALPSFIDTTTTTNAAPATLSDPSARGRRLSGPWSMGETAAGHGMGWMQRDEAAHSMSMSNSAGGSGSAVLSAGGRQPVWKRPPAPADSA